MALGGARGDLLRGIGQVAHRFSGDAQLWVISPLDNQATVPFLAARLRRTRGRRCRPCPGWAPTRGASSTGATGGRGSSPARPTPRHRCSKARSCRDRRRLRPGDCAEGGWIVLSKQIASEHHLELGGIVRLPTPTGAHRAPARGHEHELRLAHRRDLHEHPRLHASLRHLRAHRPWRRSRAGRERRSGESGGRTSDSDRAAGSK